MSVFDHPPSLFASFEDGSPAAKARKFIFQAGTERLGPLYQDQHLKFTIANPLEADENGAFPEFYIAAGVYTIRVEDENGRVLNQYDNVPTVSEDVPVATLQDIFSNYKVFSAIQSVEQLLLDEELSYQVLPGKHLVHVGEVLDFPNIGCFYEVVDASSSHHHIETAAGVKMRAVPGLDRELRTSHLGWVEGEDISAKMQVVLDAPDPRMAVLRFDGSYAIQGSRYVIPPTIEAFLSDNFELLSHGENASRSLLSMDACHESAAANGLPLDLFHVFEVPAGFKVGGLRFDHNVPINEFDLISGGNKGEWFKCEDQIAGIEVVKCRFDFSGGTGVEVRASPNWKFTDNYAGRQKTLLNVVGAAHFGVFKGNRGAMGLRALNSGGTGLQSYGDYIKTTAANNVGPRYCKVENNFMYNDHRDGVDGTGGLHGWIFDGNYFEVDVAGIDAKINYRDLSDFDQEENYYWGLTIRNNTFVGCGVVYTSTWVENNLGVPFDDELTIRGVLSDGNLFIPKSGKNSTGHYSKSTHRITSINDRFLAHKTKSAGTWNPATGEFPSNAVLGTHYEVIAGGTVAGKTFQAGGLLRPLQDNPSPSVFQLHWDFSTTSHPSFGVVPLKVDDTGSAGIFPKNIQFKGLRWDARGAGNCNLTLCTDVSMEFAEFRTDGSGFVTVGGENIKLSGVIHGVELPAGENGDADAIRLTDCTNVELDVDFRHVGAGSRGALIRVQGRVEDIWVDGYLDGCSELADVAGVGEIVGLHLGKKSGLRFGTGLNRVLTSSGTVTGVFCGEVDLNGTTLFNNEPSNHNLGKLQTGLGPVIEISSGSIDATHGVHRVDTQSQAANDTLTDIVGGTLGDRVVITAADDARTVTVQGGGNLVLGANRTLDNMADTLVLEKRGDANWHEVSFTAL